MKKSIYTSILIVLFGLGNLVAQTTVTKSHFDGLVYGFYKTSIESVVCGNNGYTITLKVVSENCISGGRFNPCKELSHFSIEAATGNYNFNSVSYSVLTGNMSGNLVNGLGNNDPFDGFKIDNVSGIGGGTTGSFTVTYTVTNLQSQQVLAKSGQTYAIASFTAADFQGVMVGNNTGCIVDTDGDGVPDDVDDFPNDGDRAFVNYYPAGGVGTLAYEDLWPASGDFDMNDMVLNYRFETVTNADNKVVDMEAQFTLLAFGASFKNGFGFQLPSSAINQSLIVATGSNLTGNAITLGSNGLESGQSKPTFIVFDNTFSLIPGQPGSIGINTDPNGTTQEPVTVTLDISFTTPTYTMAQLNVEGFNPFIIVNQNRGREVHLPYYPPTDLADVSLFNTKNDASNASTGAYYINNANLPWAINLPEQYAWPKEKKDITSVYAKFESWAESGGALNTDWYLNQIGNILNLLDVIILP